MQSAEGGGQSSTWTQQDHKSQSFSAAGCCLIYLFFYFFIVFIKRLSSWTMAWTRSGTNLVGCTLSCCCHWCRCRYCSSWCCSPCDWRTRLASCLAATAGLEAHPCWEGQVCNKEHHRAVSQKPCCSHISLMNERRAAAWGWVHRLKRGDSSP